MCQESRFHVIFSYHNEKNSPEGFVECLLLPSPVLTLIESMGILCRTKKEVVPFEQGFLTSLLLTLWAR